MIQTTLPRAAFGPILMTPGVQDLIGDQPWLIESMLVRHMRGDYGHLCDEDVAVNDIAFNAGRGTILSVYCDDDGNAIWDQSYIHRDTVLQADADLCHTTILLPSEY